MDRRHFTAVLAAVSANSLMAVDAAASGAPMKVAVIGHTGRGDYGHGLDIVWNRIDETKVVAVADANPAGLQKKLATRKFDGARGFEDYRLMLEEIRPDIVAVCPRHVDQHHDMIMAAIEFGAKGIYVEKPFVRNPAEADAVIAACGRRNVKLAVAHRNRYHPVLTTIDKIIADGKIGRLLEIHGRGKSDHRGGVEDLWVLGSHTLNLITYFGGPPKSCSAVLMKDGRRAMREDVRDGNEGLGKMAGNALHARFVLQGGVIATFDSIANDGTNNKGFGLQLVGSKAVVDIRCDVTPLAHIMEGNPFSIPAKPREWKVISTAGIGVAEPNKKLRDELYSHEIPVRQLLDAMANDTQPLCDESEAALIVEMITAITKSHWQGSAEVAFPLKSKS